MKILIFSGLVLGSVTYLVATQSDLLQGWIERAKPQAREVVNEGQHPLKQLFENRVNEAKEPDESQVISDLTQTVKQLKQDVQQLSEALSEAETSVPEQPLANEVTDKVKNPWPVLEARKPIQQVEQAADPLSAYMPVKERSDALLDLARRMEMKAASF